MSRRAVSLLLAALLGLTGQPAWPQTPEPLPEDAPMAVWRENGRVRRAYLASDELVMARPPERAEGETSQSPDPQGRFVPAGRTGRSLSLLRSYVARPTAEETRSLVRGQAARTGRARFLPVFYADKDRRAGSRLILPGELLVRYAADATAAQVAAVETGRGLTRLLDLPGRAVLYAAPDNDPFAAIEIAGALADDPAVAASQPHWLRQRTKRLAPSDPLFANQWTMLDQTTQGAALTGAWDLTLGSAQTRLAILDDGVQIAHEDLRDNNQASLNVGFSLAGGTTVSSPDPSPASAESGHGTACAGVAAARGQNGLGVCGTAPLAGLAGVRMLIDLADVQDQSLVSDALEATALGWQPQDIAVYSCSWGPLDDAQRLERPGPLAEAAQAEAARVGRGGLGSIFVWAGGNGNRVGDNSNYDGYANSPYVIAVAASTDQGQPASYSEPGANILVCAPSNGGRQGVTTTDLTGAAGYNDGLPLLPGDVLTDYADAAYTKSFGGTSSATPLVAGVAALMLDANPRLGWRDVQRILALTAYRLAPEDRGWSQNGAGLWVNHRFGFGRVDAARAVQAARTWRRLPPEAIIETPLISPNAVIPADGELGGVASAVTVTQDLAVERVEVEFSSDHPVWGNLRVVLTAPSGAQSVLAEPHVSGRSDLSSPAGHYDGWRFTSVRHLGESARGVWTLRVSDDTADNVGTFLSWKLRLRGAQRARPPAALPLLLGQPEAP